MTNHRRLKYEQYTSQLGFS